MKQGDRVTGTLLTRQNTGAGGETPIAFTGVVMSVDDEGGTCAVDTNLGARIVMSQADLKPA